MSGDTSGHLISVVRQGKLDRVEELLNSLGLNHSISPLTGFHLLCETIQNNYTEIAKLILKNISQVDGNGTPQSIFPRTVERLADGYPYPSASNPVQNIYAEFALLESTIINGDVELVEMLLDRGANVNPLFGKHPLHVAIENNRTEIVDLLLNRGADSNVRNSEDMTPLHVATIKGQLISVEKLLNKGACVNSSISETKSHPGWMPLCCDVAAGNREVTELLLENKACVNVNAVCTSFAESSTPLHLAIARRDEALVKVLLKHGAYVDARNGNAKTILEFALDENQTTIVAYVFVSRISVHNEINRNFLLDAVDTSKTQYNDIVAHLSKSSPGIFSQSEHSNNLDASIRLFLHAAIEKGFHKVVEDFMKCELEDCLLNKRAEGYTLLHAAAKNKRHKIAELLIDYGANIDAKYKIRKTPFFYAFRNADAEMTKILLSKGAKYSPGLFNAAVKTGCRKIVEVFLQICSNIDVNAKDNFGDTALHCVALFNGSDENKAEVARLLLSRGACANIRNKNGLTPLHVAVEEGYAKLVEALLENNENIPSAGQLFALEDVATNSETILNRIAKINAKTSCGMTALHIASRENYETIVKVLLKYGADINVKSQFCKTAVDMAFENGCTKAFQTLLNHGVDIDSSYFADMSSRSSKRCWITRPDNRFLFTSRKFYYIISMHLIKMRAAKRYVNDEKLECVANKRNRTLCAYRKACSEEIEKTRSEAIGRNVCFYDVLTKGINQLSRYSRNEEIALALGSKDLAKMFPIYSGMIEYNFRRGQERENLFNFSLNSFNSSIEYSLPSDVLTTEIFSYLRNEDLENLIEARHGTGMYR